MSTMTASPFHRGEQEIQTRLGVRDRMERFGQQVIRDYLPLEHRDFYQQLPYVLVGHEDQHGWPWASMLFSKNGLMTSQHPESLTINAKPVDGDPLNDSLTANKRLGLLGIELETKRRNRISAHIEAISNDGIELGIDQAFGNCPQYIHPRKLVHVDPSVMEKSNVQKIDTFDHAALQLIGCSDTFFVASSLSGDSKEITDGADVSHRGGKSGFVRIDDMYTLTIPDYSGNLHFNTLGNFLENPKGGLLFIDFKKGHMLTMTGTVEIIWESEDIESFDGAERLWRFKIDHGYWLKNVLPMRWEPNEAGKVSVPSQPIFVDEQTVADEHNNELDVASEAIITFTESNVEQAWTDDDGTILEFAEDHGLKPDFSCRSGLCGACKVQLLSGSVVYEKDIAFPVEDGEILLCCAVPASNESEGVTRLDIKL